MDVLFNEDEKKSGLILKYRDCSLVLAGEPDQAEQFIASAERIFQKATQVETCQQLLIESDAGKLELSLAYGSATGSELIKAGVEVYRDILRTQAQQGENLAETLKQVLPQEIFETSSGKEVERPLSNDPTD